MEVDLRQLHQLVSKRADEIAEIVSGTGYLPKTVVGVATFIIDQEGNLDLLTAKQRVIFDKFIEPLLARRFTKE